MNIVSSHSSLPPAIETKIVFIHKGESGYLPYVLYQAKHISPESDIVLIGDGFSYAGIHNEHLDNYQSADLQNFKNNYIHMSSNPEEFELFCWLRWFYLLEYMRKNQVHSALYLDSDVLLYSSMVDMKSTFFEVDIKCGFLIPQQDFNALDWAASAHVSYWTIDSLADFCVFSLNSFTEKKYLELYKEKWQAHVTKVEPGGICDMTTLYLYWHEKQWQMQNLLMNKNDTVFDDNVSEASNYFINEYATSSGRKKISFAEQRPYFHLAANENSKVRAHAIHFQGGAKEEIPKFYAGKYFKGKLANELPLPIKSAIGKAGRALQKLKTYL